MEDSLTPLFQESPKAAAKPSWKAKVLGIVLFPTCDVHAGSPKVRIIVCHGKRAYHRSCY